MAAKKKFFLYSIAERKNTRPSSADGDHEEKGAKFSRGKEASKSPGRGDGELWERNLKTSLIIAKSSTLTRRTVRI